MKATGIVRRIDDLGRVVIPKEIRRTLRIREGDPLEIFTEQEGEIILKKPAIWDSEGNHVNLIFLVCIQKNNLEAFRAWDYLSPLLFNNQFKQEILSVEDYGDFKRICEENLKSHIL